MAFKNIPVYSPEDLVERHGPLPAGRAIYLLRQACAVLARYLGVSRPRVTQVLRRLDCW